MEVEDLKGKIKTLYDSINNLKDSINLKDEQLSTLQSTINLKDEQIKTLTTTLELKDEKITTLEKTVDLKENEIKDIIDSTVHKDNIAEKENIIMDLKKEITILNDELAKADEEIGHLEMENEKIRTELSTSTASKIFDYTNSNITRDEIIEFMKKILEKALHSVTITVPEINELQDLYLYEIRTSVNIKISCSITPGIEEHSQLLEEYESLDNITIRNFEGEDRFIISRDGEELLMAIKGKEENNHLVIYTRDPAHIKLLNSLTMESWLRSRKI